ncbi:nitrate/nitrite transporter [Gordonia sp. (in: high G+C Gram-positive bacteria)]|jgi:NNP family nitrate/nitrite transporter-like MFS transporter|uniref:nitrate/nitrite transporter n=1 Tax=Gordonia sp. (in: high G+C Gram-positive bacteria) TaxID=84139 RepID=UPI001D48ECAA|nr:nitrate/nitrite transporter [Gordonia sp. (in: high G+C Gram-positive bacteria)]MCB1296008.1 NarK/NasA family nitrate transporter [Gordonia sp. (in: high G+C Gram-positive bacteria)]HMS77566.1 nitrate/nitrite transporter [Gordonia sp. (in: high G+C Gram-positive bacteria)]HQV18323.1 nitrate/nitrite transporter [Gordonia sp. (in: high G+C Gram-positive bacteria)]
MSTLLTNLRRDRTITDWDPEDREAWDNGNAAIAKRNLLWSVICEHVGFSIWSMFSVMALFMGPEYGISVDQKFVIAATATLVGSCLRIPYTQATARFGGRNWAIFSAVVLLIPTGLIIMLMMNPGEFGFGWFLAVAAISGFGGGNFASSMTNINAFYPQRLKGWALGLNAGGGNIGVPAIQIIGLIVIWLAADRPELVCMFYLVFLVIAGIGAALFMDNLDHQTSSAKAMVDCLKYRDTWIIGILYVGTFGSFIGFGFAFAQVLNLSFTSAGAAKPALAAAQIAWIGPLLGSLSRPYGGKLADRIGGGKVTLYTFIGMTFGAAILVFAATAADNNGKVIETGHLVGLVIGFIVLFILSGLANGSVYKIIPTIWEEKAQASTDMSPTQKVVWSRSMSGALIGIAGAVGGLGGVGINLVLRASYKSNQSATAAFWIFMAFYVVAAVITWWFYVRRQTVLTTQTTDIVVEPAVTDPIAPAPITDDTAETAEQPKVSTTSGTGTLA